MILRGFALFCFLAASPAAGAEGAKPAFSCQETPSGDIVADVTPDGDVRLAAGRVARIADIRLAESSEALRRARAWLETLGGEAVMLRELGPPDRWGRVPVHLELGRARPVDVAELLVSEGLAVVDPGQRDLLCRPELLQVEARARRSRSGLWREAGWPIAALAVDQLAAAEGRFAIIEGRIVSVGERRERTYLNFGRDWSRDFNVTITRRRWNDLKARGITAATLTGRYVRVRGIVEKRRSPTLDLTVADMLEMVETTTR
ncbi:thermonuclease family protein [Enterovirga sp. CN4-39]|uniref:thermonuclease family protein n=1 Tax=Enterovirga sp. CN4-39 TaxID=3400910 RepID=UPI003C04042B